jgi:hypothetical protein
MLLSVCNGDHSSKSASLAEIQAKLLALLPLPAVALSPPLQQHLVGDYNSVGQP